MQVLHVCHMSSNTSTSLSTLCRAAMDEFVDRFSYSIYPATTSVDVVPQRPITQQSKKTYESLYECICDDGNLYSLCLKYGILLPGYHSSHVEEQHSLYLKVWSYTLQILYVVGTVLLFVAGLLGLGSGDTKHGMAFVFICYYFGVSVQNLLLIPAFYYWNIELHRPRRISRMLFLFSIEQAKEVGHIMFIVFTVAAVLLSTLCLVAFANSTVNAVVTVAIIITAFFPINFLLTGLTIFFIAEQRASYQIVSMLRLKAENAELSCREYLNVRSDMQEKDRSMSRPLNWLLTSAVWNTVIGIVIACAMNSFLENSATLHEVYLIAFAVVYFGKQTGILFLLLEEVGRINQICPDALHSLAQQDWSLIYNPDPNVQVEREAQRIKLCIALRECPVSATILGMRFTQLQLRVQLVGALLSYVIAVLRAIILSSLNVAP